MYYNSVPVRRKMDGHLLSILFNGKLMKKLIFLLLFSGLLFCACQNAVDNFHVTEEGGVGEFSMTGTVVSKVEEAPFSGSEVTCVYLLVPSGDSEAFVYFHDLAKKLDTINKAAGDALYMKLGVLEDSNLKTSAKITEEMKGEILSALESGGEITLTMTQEITLGKGASEYTVFPSEIR